MKKFILAIVVAIAAVFPVVSSAANDSSMMNLIVKAINDQKDPSINAAWKAPYLIMNVKLDTDGCTELNQLLADKSTESYVKDMILEQFVSDPEMLEILVALEEVGLKGMRFNVTDSLNVKSTFLVTMADIRAYQSSHGKK
ncbi:MAG: hypothetical protein ACI30N_01120 [Muribaculaceae bacterium]